MYVNIVDIFLLILDDVDHFTTSENDQQFMSEKFHRLLRTADDHDIKVKSYIGISLYFECRDTPVNYQAPWMAHEWRYTK